jgi:hypothetical protein
MATWYTDVALVQQQYNNFPGAPGSVQIVQPPYWQNNAIQEGPGVITATYTVSSGATETVGDTINIAKLEAGYLIDPSFAHVNTGLTAPATTLTISVGDNDMGLLANLPIPNPSGAQPTYGQATSISAPQWVSGTTYVYGNVVQDAAASSGSFQQYDTYMCVASTTNGTTAPHSAANTVWMPCNQRYSNSIDVHAASGNVAFAGGTQLYGGPASILPYAITPGTLASGFTATAALNTPYIIQNDCWLQARILTLNTIVANTVLVFRVPVIAAN